MQNAYIPKHKEKTGTSTGSLTSQQYGRHVLQAPHCSSPPSEAYARDTPFLPLQIPAGKEMWSSRVRLSFESTRKDQLDQQLWFFMLFHVVWKKNLQPPSCVQTVHFEEQHRLSVRQTRVRGSAPHGQTKCFNALPIQVDHL